MSTPEIGHAKRWQLLHKAVYAIVLIGLLQVIEVEVAVAAAPDELARLKPGLLREHMGEERIGRDVEGHAQKYVSAALIELQVEFAAEDADLPHRMAGGQRHGVEFGDVPPFDDVAPAAGAACSSTTGADDW